MRNIWSLLLLLVFSCSAGFAWSETWRVAGDGSGDWLSIQAAVEASANGDTILISPGRYGSLHTGPNSDVVAYWDYPKELFFIGEDRHTTIIGPETYVESQWGTYGLYYGGDLAQHFYNITFENLDFAVYCYAPAWADSCVTVDCFRGISIEGASEGGVSNCRFSLSIPDPTPLGVRLQGVSSISVTSCEFVDMYAYLNLVDAGIVEDCIFQNSWLRVAVAYSNADGTFRNNIVTGGSIAILGGSITTVANNIFNSGESNSYNVNISEGGTRVEMQENVLNGGATSSIYVGLNASLSGERNDIYRVEGTYAMKLYSYPEITTATVDMRNNYWGTSDPDSIAAWIWDGNDYPEINQTVQFEPFSTVPLPTEEQSLDSFKSMFR